jgi:hypothetical protein
VHSFIKDRVPLRERHLKQLAPHEKSLRKLALKKTSLCERKNLLQRGGFADVLIKLLLIALVAKKMQTGKDQLITQQKVIYIDR